MMTSRIGSAADDFSARLSALRARLVPPMPGSAFWGWAGPILVAVFGAFLRFDRLGQPASVIFDETYYVPDAYGILRHGVETNYVANHNTLLIHGDTHIFTGGGEFVVHPPLGKVLIAIGEAMFGLNPFGWRFAVAVVGSLSVLMVARIGRRMTRSTLLGCVAGLLLALDGLEFVMSRTALLDIFVMFWALAAFGALLVDRDQARAAVAAEAERRLREGGPRAAAAGDPAPPAAARPRLRWWRLAAGIFLGLACASKWNGIWYIPAFAALSVAWDIGAWRAAGLRGPSGRALRRELGGVLGSFALAPAAVYLASWSGWFASSDGYDRNWAAQHGIHIPVVSDLISLFEYHRAMLGFNLGLSTPHPYQSEPWTWLLLARPVSYYWVCQSPPHTSCGAAGSKTQEVLAIGTPAIWWASVAALLVLAGWWLTRRDWRAGAALLAVAAGWLPWFMFAGRTQFYFYSVAFDPYLVLAITLCLGLLLGPARASARRRITGAAVVGAYLLLVLLNFWYLYPILTGQTIPYADWLSHMWYHPGNHGWI